MSDRKTTDILTTIADAERQLGDMKTVQPLGQSSFVNYTTYSSSPYDLSIVINMSVRSYRISFTHASPDSYHILDLVDFIRINNPNVMEDPLVRNTAGNVYTQVTSEIPIYGRNSWILDLVNSEAVNRTFYVKLFVKGTTSGTLSIEAL